MDCNYTEHLTNRRNIGYFSDCQRACLAYDGCKFSLHIKQQSRCEMYGSLEKDCEKVRGPPYTNQAGCPTSLTTR